MPCSFSNGKLLKDKEIRRLSGLLIGLRHAQLAWWRGEYPKDAECLKKVYSVDIALQP